MDEKGLLKFLNQLEGDISEAVEQLYQYLEENHYMASDEDEDEELASRGLFNPMLFKKINGKEYEKTKRIWAENV